MRRPERKQRQILPKVVIVCEGEVTEQIYFHGIRVARRIGLDRVVIYGAAGDPKRVVDKAVGEKKENDARNKSQGIVAADTVWAVFDRDEHRKIPEAMQKATQNGIGIAFSNPNFELFLLLHFEPLNREEHREKVTRLLKKHIPDYEKHFDYEKYKFHERYPKAKEHINVINSRSTITAGINTPPYCCVDILVDHLRTF